MTKYMFVLYFGDVLSDDKTKEFLSKIFNITSLDINSIFDSKEGVITYQIRTLDCVKALVSPSKSMFICELNVFIKLELILQFGVYNDLILARKISNLIDGEVLVYNQSDIPYLYIMAKNDELFLVEDEEEDICITFEKDKKIRLSVDKALALLPDKSYYEIESEKPAYPVKDGSAWYKCI